MVSSGNYIMTGTQIDQYVNQLDSSETGKPMYDNMYQGAKEGLLKIIRMTA